MTWSNNPAPAPAITLETLREALEGIPEPPYHFAIERPGGDMAMVKLPPSLRGKAYPYPHGAILFTTLETLMRVGSEICRQGWDIPIVECDQETATRFLAELMVDIFNDGAGGSFMAPSEAGGGR